MRTDRRAFLKGAGAASLGAASLTGFGGALGGFSANAADVSGYKALVCLFLLGGLDNYDTLIPYDQASYDRYAQIRAPLLGLYDALPGGSTRERARLMPLSLDNAADFGTREFALPEELSGIHGLIDAGNAAIVANVGPLIEPLTRAEWEADAARTPTRLFSHNDQQSTWMSSAPEGAQFGWGGRFADAALASGANSAPEFAAITTLGNELFLTGANALPYQIGFEGANDLDALEFFGFQRAAPGGEDRFQMLRQHFSAAGFSSPNLIARDIANAIGSSLQTNELFNQSFGGAMDFTTPFPDTFIGSQLRAIARTISISGGLGAARQVFFAADGGFDTHSRQAQDLPVLQSDIDGAVTAFFAAMQEIGRGGDVTLFTASDFGRTLAINGDGTDHGWGAHHFVVGEAVQGRRIYGDPPPADFGHDFDAGGGRLIPSLAVEQFAEPMGRWFGLNDAEIAAALPNLTNFPGGGPAFV